MEFAGVLIALGAVAIAGISLVFTALERRARIAELDLLRRQVEGAESDREARKKAEVTAAHGTVHGGDPNDLHWFWIVNGGPAIARAVDVWAQRESGGEDVVGPVRVAPALAVGERIEVSVPIPTRVSRAGGLILRGRWRDDAGTREIVMLPINKPD